MTRRRYMRAWRAQRTARAVTRRTANDEDHCSRQEATILKNHCSRSRRYKIEEPRSCMHAYSKFQSDHVRGVKRKSDWHQHMLNCGAFFSDSLPFTPHTHLTNSHKPYPSGRCRHSSPTSHSDWRRAARFSTLAIINRTNGTVYKIIKKKIE